MGQSHTISSQDAILKDVYDERTMFEMSFGENPWLGIVEKEIGKSAGGRRYIQDVEFENPNGGSASYSKSRSNATRSKYKSFTIDRTTQHQYIQVDHELLLATKDKRQSGSFMDAMKEFDRGFKSLGHKIGKRMYRTQGGALGQLSIVSTTTTTLGFTDNAAIFNFYVGQKLVFAAADGTGSLLDGGDTTEVLTINDQAGTLTIADDLATKISGVAPSSFVFTDGDFGECMTGLEDWLPVADRTTRLAATFNGVTRSDRSTLLGGVFRDGTAFGSTDEVMIKLGGDVRIFGGTPSHVFANPQTLTDMQLVANSKVRIDQVVNVKVKLDGEVVVGFPGFRCTIGDKSVLVMGDRSCPSVRLYMLQMNTWRFWYTGNFINWQGEAYDFPRIRPSGDTDDAESQVTTYGNLGCGAPGLNGVAQLNPAS